MKRLDQKLIVIVFFFIPFFMQAQEETKPLHDFLSGFDGLDFEEMDTREEFSEKYVVYMPQPLDHKDPSLGFFTQRVFVIHRDVDAPVVLTTEGYGAAYANFPQYRSELCGLLEANEIIVEHRFFEPSAPDSLDWRYLTVEQAATDHHKVVEFFKPFYTGKWVNSGISKGGQTAMYHRTYYPDDVDATVGYVCPLNFTIEEQRCYDFLDQVGSEECREKIHNFQKLLLCNKDRFFPAFKQMIDEEGLNFSIGDTAGYELTVLEYSFAFWQWGSMSCDKIPDDSVNPQVAILHLASVSGLSWVSDEGIAGLQPFFYQALTEIGFYGYDHSEFPGCVEALDAQTFDFSCPKGADCTFDPGPMEKVDHFVRHKGDNMIFVYGEWDPWSAPAVQITGKTNSFKVINPEGSHSTRIRFLPEEQREKIYTALEDWLDCEIKR
jgi:hypothetical protein